MRDLRALTDATQAKETLPAVLSKIDKLAKTGVIHKNKAANLKSSLAKAIYKIA
jgi:small subunit ribosomal protein S20